MNVGDHFSNHATILQVSNMDSSIKFYQELGFEVTFKWQDPITYAVLKAGDVSIHLSLSEDRVINQSTLYIFAHDIDALYETYQSNKLPIHTPIGDRDYQMRDFDIKDPDGHLITFGTGIG